MTRAAGEVAVLRYLWFGRPFWALPTRVVEDIPQRTVVWVASGTRYRRPGSRLTMEEIAANEWVASEHAWTGNGTLMISRPGERYSTWLFWDDHGAHASWYFNFEEPWRRTSVGFDSRDHQLDLVVRADGSWFWKDEAELRDAVTVGLLSRDEAQRVRADGERVLAALDRLIPTGFEEWRPDPLWPMAELPSEWDVR